MPNDYELSHKARKEANLVSPKGEGINAVRKELRKFPEVSGGAKWVDPKAIIHRHPTEPDPIVNNPSVIEQPGEVVQKI